MIVPDGFRIERGLLWPAYDYKCAKVIFGMAKDLDNVMRHVHKTHANPDTVIQAGGNCGVWPRALSPLFKSVHTFEPDPLNFRALTHNIAGFRNVIATNAAIGNDNEPVKMGLADHELDNCGAAFIEPGGTIPKIVVDDLKLQGVDLIYLDIEGFEIPALAGMSDTIARCHPVIALEDKGLSERYGWAKGDVVELLHRKGYRVAERVNKDVIMVPC